MNNINGDGGHFAVLRILSLTGSLNSGYAIRFHLPKFLRASYIPETMDVISLCIICKYIFFERRYVLEKFG